MHDPHDRPDWIHVKTDPDAPRVPYGPDPVEDLPRHMIADAPEDDAPPLSAGDFAPDANAEASE